MFYYLSAICGLHLMSLHKNPISIKSTININKIEILGYLINLILKDCQGISQILELEN